LAFDGARVAHDYPRLTHVESTVVPFVWHLGVSMIEPILMLVTVIWVLIGATLIMPHFAEKKMTRKGGRIDKLESGFHERLNRMQNNIDHKVKRLESHMERFEGKIDAFPEIPENIPTMAEINRSIDHVGKSTVDNINNLQDNLPNLMVKTIQTEEFATAIKSYEGRMYAAKGIELDKIKKLTAGYTHGMEAAEKVYIDKIQNGPPDDRTELTLILKDALQLAEENGYIEEGSTEQKIGLVHGVMKLIDRLQNRGNTSSPSNGGSLLSSAPSHYQPSHSIAGGGSELDNYYR